MSRAQSLFRERDVRRALKAAALSGHQVVEFGIDKAGKITVRLLKPADGLNNQEQQATEWDED
jgi:hypothetical protein